MAASRLAALLLAAASLARSSAFERWGVVELTQEGPVDATSFNAFKVVANATFVHAASATSVTTPFFYDGGTAYKARFCPPLEGNWTWESVSSSPAMPPQRGSLAVGPPAAGNHGPVIADAVHPRAFAFADGTPHVSVSTTAYAWLHAGDELAAATVASLRGAPFNKLRMTLFPKYYPWTHAEPPMFPYPLRGDPPPAAPCTICCPSLASSFDLSRFHPPFWRRAEALITQLLDAGIVADVILFHPYDGGHWGSDRMGMAADATYLRYASARLSAFRNVWWSMANEWSDMKDK